MAGKEEFNSDLYLDGKLVIYSVPNSTGTLLTYNANTKTIGTRTIAEIVTDMGFVTVAGNQNITGRKMFWTSGGFSDNNNALWVYSNDGSDPGITFFKAGQNSGQFKLDNGGFRFVDSSNSNYMYITAQGYRKGGSDDTFFLTGGGGHKAVASKDDSFKNSARNMDGTLITSDLDYSQYSEEAWVLEIEGNMYGGGLPLFCRVQGYIWNDSMINCTGITTVEYFNTILATNLNGKLCFYFPKFFYLQGFEVRLRVVTGAGENPTNHVVSITEQTSDPGGTKRINIPLTLLITPETVYKGLPKSDTWGATAHPVITDRRVIKEVTWNNYGSGHTIFDASAGIAPDGTLISRTEPQVPWTTNYPTWMGWNGYQTYGVGVDHAKNADNLGGVVASDFVLRYGNQSINGIKSWNGGFKNTGTGWGNTATASDYSMLFETSTGPDVNNEFTFSMGFFSQFGAQAGIYVRNNTNTGTSMAFATTDSFDNGPKISMTINNAGTVDFPRAWPTVSGNNIFHAGAVIDYQNGMPDVIMVGDPWWAQRKLLSTHWNGTYGYHLILRPVGLSANTSTFKLSQNGNGYLGDKRILTEVDFNPVGYLPLSGGTLTGGGRISPQGNIVIQQEANGGNATGMFWEKIDNSANMSGIGTLTTNGNLDHMFMGWGALPWDTINNFSVSETRFTYKGNEVFHSGNLNPVRIGGAGTAGNPIYLGWDNNNLRLTVDNSYIGNLWHSNNFNPSNYHRIDYAGALNNASSGRHNTTWFDYNWADTGSPGSVISFGGLNSEYTGELFMQYNSAIMRVGVRSHNGNFNQWNAPRFLWHDGHFTQADVDHWKSLSSGIMLNADFTNTPNGTFNQVAISDDIFGGESGLYHLSMGQGIAIYSAGYYKYGGSPSSFDGINYNPSNNKIGIGRDVDNSINDKIQLMGDISVGAEGWAGNTQLILNPLHTYDSDISQSRHAHIYVVTRSTVILPTNPIFGQKIEIHNFGTTNIDVTHNNVGTLFSLPGECKITGIVTMKGFMFDRDPVPTIRYDI